MKTKSVLTGLLLIIISSCNTPKYLPSSADIDVHPFGSYITIRSKTSTRLIRGELIAIDTDKIVVLTERKNECITVPITEVKQFKLLYAKPKHYGWSIPIALVLPLAHGWYSAFTIPLHLIVTVSVTVGGENAFKYSTKEMTYDKLKMFARFPQGIPPNVDVARINASHFQHKIKKTDN